MDLSILERRLGIVFRDKNLLKQALTHRSYLNENRQWLLGHNERLEFLGDAVIELIASCMLFSSYPNKPEGELTKYRAALVNNRSLAESVKSLKIDDFILISQGEARSSTERGRQHITASVYEAIVGAAYLDQGFDVARELVDKLVLSKANHLIAQHFNRDCKSRLQEITQERLKLTPTYRVLEETGPDHDKEFLVGVFFGEDCIAKGRGPAKQRAEEKAAEEALVSKGWMTK